MRPSSTAFRLILLATIFIAAVVGSFFLPGDESSKEQSIDQRLLELELQLSRKQLSDRVFVITELMESLRNEIEDRGDGSLSKTSITQLYLLARDMEPLETPGRDSTSTRLRSPLRGQLLTGITGLPLDTATMDSIYAACSFAYADLRGVQIHQAYLRGIDLRWADLSRSDFSGSDFTGADLKEAKLYEAKLTETNLTDVFFDRGDLSWADLAGARVLRTSFHGCTLRAAKFRNLDLTQSDMRWSLAPSIFLNGSDLKGVPLQGIDFKEANLSQADLRGARFRATDLQRAILTEAKLDGLRFADDAWDVLKNSRVVGLAEVEEHYTMKKDTAGSDDFILLHKSRFADHD